MLKKCVDFKNKIDLLFILETVSVFGCLTIKGTR